MTVFSNSYATCSESRKLPTSDFSRSDCDDRPLAACSSFDVADPEGYKAYVAANAEPFRKYGAKFLVRGGTFEAKEGTSRSRNVVLEFPSYQAALACYQSPEYQRAIALRTPYSDADIIVIEGYEGPQPSG